MRRLVSYLLSNQRVHRYLKNTYDSHRSGTALPIDISIAEITPLNTRESKITEKRINLIIPALSTKHVFGGIATALALLESISSNNENVRIILSDEATFTHDDNPAFSSWTIKSLQDEDTNGRHIIPAGCRYEKSLAVAENDVFIATAWWTASLAKQIQEKQLAIYNKDEFTKFFYLIQDFEPGFYPWSSRYALADSTYRDSSRFIPIFNTKILNDFFIDEGYEFENSLYFNPVLHPQLRDHLKLLNSIKKQKTILIYGRPSVDRNCFSIIVQALNLLVKDTESSGWDFISVGENHQDVPLENGKFLISRGKLTISEYAKELASAYAGISLMVSPHPSYPPLEMAAFNVQVLTNKYKSKDLAQFSSNIISTVDMSPGSLAKILKEILQRYDLGEKPTPAPSAFIEYYITSNDQFSDIKKQIADLI